MKKKIENFTAGMILKPSKAFENIRIKCEQENLRHMKLRNDLVVEQIRELTLKNDLMAKASELI